MAVDRAVSTLYPNVTIDIVGDKSAQVRVERQDVDEMLGNLVENAAKYGHGRVFVTVEAPARVTRRRARKYRVVLGMASVSHEQVRSSDATLTPGRRYRI
jgi:signal transduction histidine kinase